MSAETGGNRAFDYPDRYEREKVTRVMPRDLKAEELYTWRMRMPNGNPFAVEFLTCIVDSAEQENGEFRVRFIFFPQQNSMETELADTTVSEEGFSIVRTPEGEVIEQGYFVGSTDPYDIEMAELVQKAHELTLA